MSAISKTDRPSYKPLLVCVYAIFGASVLPTALGQAPLPGSLTDGPDIFGQGCTITIAVGCLVAFLGTLWWRDKLDALVIEQAGLMVLAAGCLLYASALLGVDRLSDARIAFGISAGLGVGSAVQARVLRQYARDRKAAIFAQEAALDNSQG